MCVRSGGVAYAAGGIDAPEEILRVVWRGRYPAGAGRGGRARFPGLSHAPRRYEGLPPQQDGAIDEGVITPLGIDGLVAGIRARMLIEGQPLGQAPRGR